MNIGTRQSKASWGLGLAALGVVAGLGIVLAPVVKQLAYNILPQPTAAPYDARIESPTTTFDTAVKKNDLVSGTSDIKVVKGTAVRVNITAVGPDEVHASLPGYGISTEVASSDDTPGGFSFVADKTGVFPFYSDTKDPMNGKVIAQRKLGTITVQ